MNRSLPRRFAAVVTAAATALAIVAIAILPFLTEGWVAFEQDRTGAAELTGYEPGELRLATGAILHDLIWGPPDFDVTDDRGQPVLDARERGHMRDVRGVFGGFYALSILAAAGLVAGYVAARRIGHPERWWAAVRGGAIALAVGVVAGGIVAAVAFDAAFDLFHRIFFPGGSYTFDPGTDRLIQLFPFAFWSETTIVLGGLILVLAAATTGLAGRRLRRSDDARERTPLTAPEAAS